LIRRTTQGFSRREREIPFEPANRLAREADGCKPALGSPFTTTPFSGVPSASILAGSCPCFFLHVGEWSRRFGGHRSRGLCR
ncbi:MAG TPA: hypothetical protein VI837_10105, partial [Blastocatellia bacterium]|nr:hypothetical protein [Blastocatellia bacterium]